MIGNSCNVGLAVYGNMHHEKDFATYLLAVLMTNLIMYTFFYIAMKVSSHNSEGISEKSNLIKEGLLKMNNFFFSYAIANEF